MPMQGTKHIHYSACQILSTTLQVIFSLLKYLLQEHININAVTDAQQILSW